MRLKVFVACIALATLWVRPCNTSPLLLAPQKIVGDRVTLVALNIKGLRPFTRIVPSNCSIECLEVLPSAMVTSEPAEPHPNDFAVEILMSVPESLPRGMYTIQLCNASSLATPDGQCMEDTLLANVTNVKIMDGPSQVVSIVEIDKPIYKDGQRVQIRAICFNKDFLPCTNSQFQVSVTNPMGFRIFKQKGPGGEFGVLTTEMDIIEGSPVGEYKVDLVTAGDGFDALTATQHFSVEEYVLPKFLVKIELDQDFLSEDSTKISGVVSSQYTYGKPVKGLVMVTLSCNPRYHPFYFSRVASETERAVKGSVEATVLDASRPELKRFDMSIANHGDCSSYVLHAEMKEDGTGIKQVAEETLQILHQSISAAMHHESEYAPGLPFVVEVEALDNQGKKAKGSVKVEISSRKSSYWIDHHEIDPISLSQVAVLDEKSTNLIHFTIPEMSQECQEYLAMANEEASSWWESPCHDALDITLYLASNTEGNMTESTYVSSSCIQQQLPSNGIYLTAFVPQEHRIVESPSEELEVVLYTSSPDQEGEKTVTVMFVAKGRLLSAEFKNVTFTSPENLWAQAVLTIMLPEDAALFKSVEVILGVLDGETLIITKTEIEISFVPTLSNHCTIQTSKTSCLPGEKLNLTVGAFQGSQAFLLAVDESVSILDSRETQLTRDQLFRAIKGDDEEETFVANDPVVPQEHCSLENGLSESGIAVGGVPKCGYSISPSSCNTYVYMLDFAVQESAEVFADGGVGMKSNIESEPASPPGDSSPSKKVRSFFPESWLSGSDGPDLPFGMVSIGDSNQTIVEVTAPDTITTYQIYGFSQNSEKGMGVAGVSVDGGHLEPARITIFRDVFVQLNLPYSVKLGEVATATGSIFNYQNHDLSGVKLSLSGSGATFALGNDGSFSKRRNVEVDVTSNSGASFTFQFKGESAGLAIITLIQASKCTTICDGVERSLLVKPSGSRQQFSSTKMITSSGQSPLVFKMPDFQSLHPIEGSVKSQFSIIGDIMGPTMQNLGRLINLPSGCGEQNMIGFSPNVFALHYMNSVGAQLPKLKTRALRFINIGYQRELQFIHQDGSFSAFGESDEEGSSWLTAFVLKCFVQAHTHTDFEADEALLKKSLGYILDLQITDESSNDFGAFETKGQVYHENMIGSAASFGDVDKAASMTAYKTIMLLEYRMSLISKQGIGYDEAEIDQAISRGLQYLKQTVISQQKKREKYAYILAAYTMAYAATMGVPEELRFSIDGVNLSDIEGTLGSLSSTGEVNGLEMLFWQTQQGQLCSSNSGIEVDMEQYYYECSRAPTSEIEMTSYALLTKLALVKSRRESPSLSDPDVIAELGAVAPIVRWLVDKRSELGGYSSTQDTVVALQALSEYASFFPRSGSSDLEMDVTITYGSESYPFQSITGETMDLLQVQPLDKPLTFEDVSMDIKGNGFAIATLSTSWYISPQTVQELASKNPPFDTKVSFFTDTTSDTRRKLHAVDETGPKCILAEYNITSKEKENTFCGMVLAQLEHPSGYVLATEGCPLSEASTAVQSIEEKGGGISVYISCIEPGSTIHVVCKLCETHEVQDRVATEAKVYRYYKPDVVTTVMVPYELTAAAPGTFQDFGKGAKKKAKNCGHATSTTNALVLGAAGVLLLLLALL